MDLSGGQNRLQRRDRSDRSKMTRNRSPYLRRVLASDNLWTRKSTVEFAELDISSVPPNADIEIDGGFGGSTPSSIRVDAGEHAVRISKKGYAPWERKIRPTAGPVRIVAELEQGPLPAAGSLRPTSAVLSPAAQPAVPAAVQPAAVASTPVSSPEPRVSSACRHDLSKRPGRKSRPRAGGNTGRCSQSGNRCCY